MLLAVLGLWFVNLRHWDFALEPHARLPVALNRTVIVFERDETAAHAAHIVGMPFNRHVLKSVAQRRIIATLVTSRSYVLAAACMAASLRRVGTQYPVVALVTEYLTTDATAMAQLALGGFDYAVVVQHIANPAMGDRDTRSEKVKARVQAHKADVFTKMRVFSLDEYERILFIDADCIVMHSVDRLLAREFDAPFAYAPSLQPMKRCEQEHAHYRFKDSGFEWCQSHVKTPYHGTMELKNHNTGVMLLSPSRSIFAQLMLLLSKELDYEDSCIGKGGCNDQRVINMYYHEREHARLSLRFNIFCDQMHTLGLSMDDLDPAVVHYRGGSKPWTTFEETSFAQLEDIVVDAHAGNRIVTVSPKLFPRASLIEKTQNQTFWSERDKCNVFAQTLQRLLKSSK